MDKHPLEEYGRNFRFSTSEALISFIKRFLNIEDIDRNFIRAVVELSFWAASEIAVGRKIVSLDKNKENIYEIPRVFNKDGIEELMTRRTNNYNKYVENKNKTEKDLDWLENNLGREEDK